MPFNPQLITGSYTRLSTGLWDNWKNIELLAKFTGLTVEVFYEF